MNEQKSQQLTLTWNDQELTTFGDIAGALSKLTSPDEARKFMAAYREVSPYADQNVGYMSGYEDTETMQRIQEWCEVEHPVFGRSVPTPEEAVAAGQAFGADRQGPAALQRGARERHGC